MPAKSKGRALAYRILKQFAEEETSLSHLLEKIHQQDIENRELSLAYELIMGVVRWLGKIDYILALFSKKSLESLDIPVRTSLRLGVYQMIFLEKIPHRAAVDESVELVKMDKGLSGASFVNGVLRKISRDQGKIRYPGTEADVEKRLSIMYSHPEWFVSRWLRRFGETETEKMLDANNRHAPISLWINKKVHSVGFVVEKLKKEGMEATPSNYLEDSFTVQGGSAHRTEIFKKGGYYIQDEASQMIPLLFGAKMSGKAADLCAAPGGKGLKIAESLSGEGFVVGIDISFSRLKTLKDNIARLNVDNFLPVLSNVEKDSPLKCEFDFVLADAPCSGTGVIRRKPDIKWRLKEDDIVSLASRQLRMLERAKQVVKAEGLLLYSVCSIEEEETEGVIDSFCKGNPAFQLENPRNRLPERVRKFVDERSFFRTFPHRDGLDGFFAALLRRKA